MNKNLKTLYVLFLRSSGRLRTTCCNYKVVIVINKLISDYEVKRFQFWIGNWSVWAFSFNNLVQMQNGRSQWLLYRETNPVVHRKDSCSISSHVTNNKNYRSIHRACFNDTALSQVTFSTATWSPWRGDLYGAQVVRRLVCGRSYKVVVEAVVAEFEQLHEQTVLRLIVQVQVLPRSLKTNKHSASVSCSLQETTS